MSRFNPAQTVRRLAGGVAAAAFSLSVVATAQQAAPTPIVLHAARLLDIDSGTIPGQAKCS